MWIKNKRTGALYEVSDDALAEYLIKQEHFEETDDPTTKKKPAK